MRQLPRLVLVVPAIFGLAAAGCTSPPHEARPDPLEPVAVNTSVETPVEASVEPAPVEAPKVDDTAVATATPVMPTVAETPTVAEPTTVKAPDPAPADDGLMRIQIAKGDTFKYSSSTIADMVMNIEMMGMEVKNHTEIEQDISMEVIGRRDLGWDIRITFDDVRIKGKTENPMMGTTEFDSTSGDAGADTQAAMAIEMATMAKGKSIEVTLSEDGRVAEFRGLEAITPEMPGGMGAMMSGGTGAASEQQIREFFFALPETAPTQGMSWTTSRTQDTGPMKMAFSTDHTVSTLSDAACGIALAGDVSLEIAADEPDGDAEQDFQVQMAREMMKTMKLESSAISGAVEISRKNGLVESRSSEMKMKMSMENPQAGTMKIDQAVTSTLKRTK